MVSIKVKMANRQERLLQKCKMQLFFKIEYSHISEVTTRSVQNGCETKLWNGLIL